MDQPVIYVNLDVHKETVALALAEAGRELRFCSLLHDQARWHG
jgi:hypothetical protein